MEKRAAVSMVYQLATLTHPTDDVMSMLMPLPYERTMELMLMIRQSGKPVKSPINFLRRAIAEGWTPDTIPERVNRKMENIEMRSYLRKGYSEEQAAKKVMENRTK